MINQLASEAPPMGHNAPPPLKDILAENYADLVRTAELVADRAATLPDVRDDSDLGVIGDAVKTARELVKTITQARKLEKDPHLNAGRDIDSFFNRLVDIIERAMSPAEIRADVYQRRKAAEARRAAEEAARVAREEAERQRQIAARAEEANRVKTAAKHLGKVEEAVAVAEQAEAVAVSKPADLTRVRSDGGGVVSATSKWAHEIVDISAIPLDALRPYIPRTEIDKAIRAYIRTGHRELAGVRIFEDVKAVFR